MVESISNTISSLLSRLNAPSKPSSSEAVTKSQPSSGILDDLEISDAARARFEDDLAVLDFLKDIPNQLRQSEIEFDQQRLGEIEKRLDTLVNFNSESSDRLLNQMTSEVLSIARRSLELSPSLTLSSNIDALNDFLS